MSSSVTNLSVPDALVNAARRQAELPEEAGLAAMARYALARMAGWDQEASVTAARIREHRRRPGDSRPRRAS